jgi:hypothetical protein
MGIKVEIIKSNRGTSLDFGIRWFGFDAFYGLLTRFPGGIRALLVSMVDIVKGRAVGVRASEWIAILIFGTVG